MDLKNSKKVAILDFFQIVFGSKNVDKQSCRSMKFQKGGHLGFSKLQKGGHLGFFKWCLDPKMLLNKVVDL